MDLGAGSGGRPSKIMKTIDSVREVCTFQEKACILHGSVENLKKVAIPFGRGEHDTKVVGTKCKFFLKMCTPPYQNARLLAKVIGTSN